MNDLSTSRNELVLPATHPLSLLVCSQRQVDELCHALPNGVANCHLISPGLVKLTLQVVAGGYSSRVWSIMVGGAGIGDDAPFVLQFGGSSRSPLAVRFQQPLSMYGVDDAGFVDATFWNSTSSNNPLTLRIIAERAVQWLSGPLDDPEGRILWDQAEQHYINKQHIMDTYIPQCSALFCSGATATKDATAMLRREWLAPGLAMVLFDSAADGNNQQRMTPPPTAQALLEAASVFQLAHTESGGIYSFNLFTEAFCELFEAEIDAFKRSGLPCRRPNTMNKGGLVVNDIGMESFMTDLLTTIIEPLAAAIYPREIFITSLDHHHSFVVAYDAEGK